MITGIKSAGPAALNARQISAGASALQPVVAAGLLAVPDADADERQRRDEAPG